MNRRKLAALLASLSLVAVIGIGVTLAYFTDNASIQNIIVMGKVDIRLTENKVHKDPDTGMWVQDPGEEAITEEGLAFTDVLPGETVPKNPTVTVEGDSADTYIRVMMEIKTGADSTITQADLELLDQQLRAQILAENPEWFYESGYYYFSKALKADQSAVLFRQVTIPPEWVNNTAEQSFSIQLQAEAVQADYFTPQRDEAGHITGWADFQP